MNDTSNTILLSVREFMDPQSIITAYLEMHSKLLEEFHIPIVNVTWGHIKGSWCDEPINYQNVCLYLIITQYTIKLRILEGKWVVQLCDTNRVALVHAPKKFYNLTDPELPKYMHTIFSNNLSTRSFCHHH